MEFQILHQWAWLVLLAGVIGTYAEYYFHRKWSWSFALRACWLTLICFVVLNLVLLKSVEWSEAQPIEIYVDRSDSVAQIDSRRTRADQFLSEVKDWATSRQVPLQIFSFSDSLKKTTEIEWGGYKSLFSAIEAAVAGNQSSQRVVVSDGIWTDLPNIQESMSVVDLGDHKDRDLWVDEIPQSLTAFLKNRLTITGVIREKGFSGETVSVSLWKGTEKLSQQKVKLQKGKTAIQFNYFPEKMGEDFFLLKVEPLTGELSSLNNIFPFKVRTVRDKMRLLHICGRPSQDLKNWRAFLTRQPDVDLVSFYILRSLEDNPEAKDYELSLIPFPYEDLFSVELEKFDVVILQNFDFNLYFQPFYLSNLARFVEHGGGLLMVGGDMSFHKYNGSPLENLFPFSFGASGGVFEERQERVKSVRTHPISVGLEAAVENRQWTARHKILSNPDGLDLFRFVSEIPFLSIRDAGRGRVVTVNSDETWELQMYPSDDGPVFSKLARRILQYLTFDPEMEPAQFVSDEWAVGKKVHVRLQGGMKSSWRVESIYGPRAWMAEYPASDAVEFIVPFAGLFQIVAVESNKSKIFQTREQPWKDEWKYLSSDFSKLSNLSESASHRILSFDKRSKIFDQKANGRQMISAEISSWIEMNKFFSWIVLAAIILFFCLDIWLRKKSSLDF